MGGAGETVVLLRILLLLFILLIKFCLLWTVKVLLVVCNKKKGELLVNRAELAGLRESGAGVQEESCVESCCRPRARCHSRCSELRKGDGFRAANHAD